MKDKGIKMSGVSVLMPKTDKDKLDELVVRSGIKQKELLVRLIRHAHSDNTVLAKLATI